MLRRTESSRPVVPPDGRVSHYLGQLEQELSRQLSKAEIQERLAEVDSHLRDGIEGRLELGLDLNSAEREAVQAFGSASAVALAILHTVNARLIALRLRLLATAYGALCAHFGVVLLLSSLGLLKEAGRSWGVILLAFYVGLLTKLACTSFRARRAAPVPLLSTGVIASLSLWVFFGFFWLNLWNYGGTGFQTRLIVSDSVRHMKEELTRPQGHLTATEDNLRAVSQAIADPVGNWASQLPWALGVGLSFAGLFTLVDGGFAALGGALNVRKRRASVV